MAITFDIEVWLPSIKEYKGVSSVSWAADYQARRANIHFRRERGRRPEYVHTLNASGLATSRVFLPSWSIISACRTVRSLSPRDYAAGSAPTS